MAAGSGSPGPAGAPDPARARRVLAVLFVVYVFNFVDRNLLSILLQPIKEELGASDTAMGFLTGFAFAVFYTAAGIPIARWADRGSRRTVIAVGLAAWSLMTAASGLVRSFAQLAVARIGVGVGEAAASPAAHSLLSDYFPREQRTRALAVYNSGASAGILVGLALGGWLQEIVGWRGAFVLLGLPGLAMALMVRAAVPEPPRGLADGVRDSGEQLPLRVVRRYLFSLRSFRHMTAAASLYAMTSYGMITWAPTFFVRVHGLGYADVGLRLGLVIGLCGALGQLLSGIACDRLGQRDARWQVWAPAIASLGMLPLFALFALLSDPGWALLAFAPVNLLNVVFAAPTYAITQALAPLRMRALAAAIVLFVLNLIGMGLGPQAVGVLNDLLAPRFGDAAIRYSLLALVSVNVWGAVHSLLAARTLRADLARADAR